MPTIHPLLDVQSTHIGGGTRVWQFSVIQTGARVGTDCNIASHVFIENDVIIGDRVAISAGAMVGEGAVVTHNVPENAIVMSNPAVITKYVNTETKPS